MGEIHTGTAELKPVTREQMAEIMAKKAAKAEQPPVDKGVPPVDKTPATVDKDGKIIEPVS